MNHRPLKLLALGGSNTRMKQGYMASLARVLEGNGFPTDIRNISLGANTCVMGLISLETEPDLGTPDVVIVEYAVNDYALMLMNMQRLWAAAYEGLVRQVASRWPQALICGVILGRGDSEAKHWQPIVDGTRQIVDRYPNAVFVDCPAVLHPRLQDADRAPLYGIDLLHYNDTMQAAVGTVVAGVIGAAIEPKAEPLPTALASDVLFPVKVIDFPSLSKDQVETFKNSAVQADSLRVAAGGSISVELPGRLIAISFISRPDGGSFVMQMNGRSAVVHTLHRTVRSGEWKFLPLSAVGDWWEGPNEPGLLTIQPLYNAPEHADWPVFHVGPAAQEGAAVYLHQALVRADAAPVARPIYPY